MLPGRDGLVLKIPETGERPHGARPPRPEDFRLILLPAPAHLMALAAFLVSALLLFVAPRFAAAPLVVFVATCLAAPLFPQLSFYLPILSRGRKGVPGVALTFDDGPDPQVTPLVLDLLDRHGVKATFFVIGSKAEAHPDLIQDILARGHAVGNHYPRPTRPSSCCRAGAPSPGRWAPPRRCSGGPEWWRWPSGLRWASPTRTSCRC